MIPTTSNHSFIHVTHWINRLCFLTLRSKQSCSFQFLGHIKLISGTFDCLLFLPLFLPVLEFGLTKLGNQGFCSDFYAKREVFSRLSLRKIIRKTILSDVISKCFVSVSLCKPLNS